MDWILNCDRDRVFSPSTWRQLVKMEQLRKLSWRYRVNLSRWIKKIRGSPLITLDIIPVNSNKQIPSRNATRSEIQNEVLNKTYETKQGRISWKKEVPLRSTKMSITEIACETYRNCSSLRPSVLLKMMTSIVSVIAPIAPRRNVVHFIECSMCPGLRVSSKALGQDYMWRDVAV